MKMNKIAAILLLLLSFSLQAGQASINSLRLWSAPDHTRLVFDTSASVQHKIFSLTKPERLVIDFTNTRLNTSLAGFKGKDRYVRSIRSSTRNGGSLRIVLDLKGRIKPKIFALAPNREYGHRLVLDLFSTKNIARVPVKKEVVKQYKKYQPARDVVIAIDAGHGGEDPGAIGTYGTREKDVVLSIARKLEALVSREKGMRPVMIRTGDYYLGLRKRSAMARRKKADLFISIHADAFRNKRVQGSSVYTLSNRGASSEAARWLAERENSADLVGGVELKDKDDVLASVLLDLSQTGTRQASHDVAAKVLGRMRRIGKVHHTSVQKAGFAVLKSPDVPSILVETAFISNPTEEKRLRSHQHQNKLAKSILSGIRDYFHRNPPPGTLLAQRLDHKPAIQRKHVTNRGDTLAMIAKQYQVSVNGLRSANSLSNDVIRIGQVLQIP
ncbi:MAG: AMIN domain-containing protein [Gammaproteobacteria bacterium]|nr:AMIN domain-containing protein [Gammaproteobacteria bacterium]